MSVDEALSVAADPHMRFHYSQFGEDVVLWSLLQTFGRLDSPGRYVDVGALHPTHMSNTAMLRHLGWRGVNIDANPDNLAEFDRLRPDDVNVQAAISDQPEDVEFTIFDIAGLSTADPRMLAKHAVSGQGKVLRRVVLRTRTLADVLSEALSPDDTVDVMSVDVEGFDLKALRSHNWDRYAPFFLLVEDHEISLLDRPKSPVFDYLTPLGYRLAAQVFVTSIYVRDQL